jgi:CRP/FNR family transcriptional regulator
MQRTALFDGTSSDALRSLAAVTAVRKLRRDEILFSAGDAAQGMYVIVSGALRAFRNTPEGREQTIHVEHAGATLAEVPVFDGGPYPSTVQAEEHTVVLFLPRGAVHQFFLAHPGAALAALRLLAKRLRSVAGLAEKLALQDVTQRLAAMLMEEATRQADKLKDGASFSLPLSHQSIASRLGSVREVITRNLRKLAEEEIIEIRGHRIVVLNAAALRARAGDQG